MNIKFLEKVFNNWIPKIVCLGLSLLLYMQIQNSSLVTKEFTVPLHVLEDAEMTLLSSPSSIAPIKVSVRGRTEQLSSVTDQSLDVFVDISSKTKAGRYKFPIYVKQSDALLLMDPLEIRLGKETISLEIDKKVKKYINIKANLAGSPAHGYEASSVQITPPYIEVTGPASIIESISTIQTEKVDIEGLTRISEQDVLLRNENSHISFDTKNPVHVSVQVEKSKVHKNFTDISIEFKRLNPLFEITSDVKTTDIVFSGQLLQLENMSSATIKVSCDCSSINEEGTYSLPISVLVPSGLALDKQSVESVQVTAKKKAESAEE